VNLAAGAAAVYAAGIARTSFLRACELDVAVRKPGNVSRFSSGHGMQAAVFDASARASAEPLLRRGARVGERIEAAVAATWAVAGCNTNLGILLLCAPVARAFEQCPDPANRAALRAALETVLSDLDVADARAAYRAIARARPGGLGTAPAEDVHAVPSIDLRAAMALAADRDSIARQYRDGYAELFELGVPPLAGVLLDAPAGAGDTPAPALAAAVQRVFLAFLARFPDSHIVRKHARPWHTLSCARRRSGRRARGRASISTPTRALPPGISNSRKRA